MRRKAEASRNSLSRKQRGIQDGRQRVVENRQAEIDEEIAQAPRHPEHLVTYYEYAISAHRKYAKWQRRFGSVQEAVKFEKAAEIFSEDGLDDD